MSIITLLLVVIVVGYLKIKFFLFLFGYDDLGTSKSNSELHWETSPEDFV